MSKTHWKKLNNPDFLGAYALEPGEDLVLTIDRVKEEQFTGTGGKKDEGIVVHFKETGVKPMICNATNAKAITKVAGSPYIEDWSNTKIAFYAAEVSAFGETVDALRVRPFAPKVEEYICSDCGCTIKDEGKFSAKVIANQSKSKYGAYLCMSCAKARKAALEEDNKEGDVL